MYITNETGLQSFYEAIISKNETYAPVESFGIYNYRKVVKLGDCNPDSPIKSTSSIKPLFFPQTSEIQRFRETHEGINLLDLKPDLLQLPKVILGVKLCDARSLEVIDKVAKWDFIDDDYAKRRSSSTIIAVLCPKAESSCFCTSLDYEIEDASGADVLVVKTGDNIYLKPVTEKGEKLLDENKSLLKTSDNKEDGKIKEQFVAFKGSFTQTMNYAEVNTNMQQAFDSEEFNEVAKNCVGCNACAFVCPTCHCFKISDEKVKDMGVRYKGYDSCNSKYFTQMAGGHNPRPVKYRRWRQRAMHKFVYYKERFGVNLCVGCGKCVNSCPVNISIFDVSQAVAYNKAVN
jgi:sulfhydrogenase subunit beta (sulfur reductase)